MPRKYTHIKQYLSIIRDLYDLSIVSYKMSASRQVQN